MDEKIRHLVGEPWSDNNGAYGRNQTQILRPLQNHR